MRSREAGLPTNDSNVILVTGPEGAGKSTHARLLAEHQGLPLISFGGLVRERIKNDQTKIGDACREAARENGYVVFNVMKQILIDRLQKEDVQGGFVVEGALRTEPEVRKLPEILEENGFDKKNITVISLRIPIWESVRRLTDEQSRRERGSRADDTEEGVLGRLKTYYSGLGIRTSIARRNEWKVEQVRTFGRKISEVQEDIRGRIATEDS